MLDTESGRLGSRVQARLGETLGNIAHRAMLRNSDPVVIVHRAVQALIQESHDVKYSSSEEHGRLTDEARLMQALPSKRLRRIGRDHPAALVDMIGVA